MSLRQPLFGFQVDEDRTQGGVTSFAGLPVLLEAARALGVSQELAGLDLFRSRPGDREMRFSEAILALIAAGGACLSDIEALRADPGLARLLGEGSLPDARRLGEFLARFHDPSKVAGVEQGRAVIPEESAPLQSLGRVNDRFVGRIQQLSPSKVATLDWDAQCIESHKREALWVYKGYTGYQPAAVLWQEQGMILADQFRPGNVPSEFQVKDFVQSAVEKLPGSVERVEFRGDAGAYNWDLMRYFSRRPEGKILFAITADSNETLRTAVRALPETAWQKLHRQTDHGRIWRGESWAEVPFVSSSDTSLQDDPPRFIAIRYPLEGRVPQDPGQSTLFELPDAEAFRSRYRVVATNRSESGDRVLLWHAERCGTIERVYKVMNHDQAAARFPSGLYGANAAWYRFNVLLFNLVQALRVFLLPGELAKRDLKAIRLHLLRLAGRVVLGASRIWLLRIPALSRALDWMRGVRSRIQDLHRQVRSLPVYAPG